MVNDCAAAGSVVNTANAMAMNACKSPIFINYNVCGLYRYSSLFYQERDYICGKPCCRALRECRKLNQFDKFSSFR